MHYGNYQFICKFETDAQLPPYKGSTFRGIFGHALKKVSCVLKVNDCKDCILKTSCTYTQIFEPALAASQSNGNNLPAPYVIEPDMTAKTDFQKNDTLNWQILVFGPANDKLPYIIYAFNEMGKQGIGKRINGNRGRFTLAKVMTQNTEIYSAKTGTIETPASPCQIGGTLYPSTDTAPRTTDSQLTVRFETPLRLKHNNSLNRELPFHVFTRALLRRASTLMDHYGQGEPNLDYKGLIQKADTITTIHNDLTWTDWQRYSNRQKSSMNMGGLTGTITYAGDLEAYLPLIAFGQEVHIGKQTTFGLGKFVTSIKP